MQQAVIEARARDPDVIGQVETSLERTGRYAAIQELGLFGVLFLGFFAGYDKLVGFRSDVELGFAEPGHRHRNAIVVLAGAQNVVRRVTSALLDAVR